MPNIVGSREQKAQEKSGLAHRIVHYNREFGTRATSRPEGYNTERVMSGNRGELRRRHMYKQSLHGVAAVTKAHRSRVAVGAAHKRKERKAEEAAAAAKEAKKKARKKKTG